MNKSLNYFRWLFFMIMTGCIEIIPFETDFSKQLVINGKITNSTTHTPFVSISFTTLDGSSQQAFVSEAQVTLIEDSEIEIPFEHIGLGKYEPPVQFTGKPGGLYEVRVSYEGKTYRSMPERMPEVIGRDYISFTSESVTRLSREGIEISIPVVNIFLQTELPDEDLLIRWDIEEVYTYTEMILPAFKFPFYSPELCFITRSVFPDEIPLFSSIENTVKQIPERLFLVRPIDETFEEIHYFGVIQNSLTPEAYNYWTQINDAANRDGTLFETPPAAVRGNLYEEDNPDNIVFGYFEAARVDTTSFFVTPEILSLFVAPLCDVIPASRFERIPSMCSSCVIEDLGVSPSCLDCLLLQGSSKERPPYFPDIGYD